MEKITNEYQLSKTLRFGLTAKSKVKKTGFTGELFESYSELKDLVKISDERVKQSVSATDTSELGLSVDGIRKCLFLISDFAAKWQKVYLRSDQLALDKDYYKILCKKIGFEGFWKDNYGTKKPQSRIIALSELNKKDNLCKERKSYIIDYWSNHLLMLAEKYNNVNEKLKQFEEALKINRTDNKPNEVELRKMFLSLASIVVEILKPLCLGQISFPKLEKLNNTKTNDLAIIEFATDYQSKSDLLSEITELRKYFEENGGNVPFCRATLNPNTAVKNPKSTNNSIVEEVKKLGLDTILKGYKSALFFANDLGNLPSKEKLEKLSDEKISLITRGLLFKYKPIPAIVQYEIAKMLSPQIKKTEHDVLAFLQNIGQAKSPAKDYADLQNKNDFNIESYPLKVAFDFAWEGLARAEYHSDIDFPTEVCKKFLNDNFAVETDNINFKLYAQLQELRSILASLEHGKPANEQEFKESAKKILEQIKWSEINNGNKHKSAIEGWLKNNQNNEIFKGAKQQIGLFRGGLKNNMETYYKITQKYKNIAKEMGGTFAEMRDKISGAAELNKVTHYAMIIEDRNCDKYVLLQEFTDNEKDRIYQQTKSSNSDFTTYSVNSITSSAIAKMLKKIRVEKLRNKNGNNIQQPELTAEQKEKKNIAEWTKFIEEKNWHYEFNLKLKDKNFEQIKKEIDSKCYQFNKEYFAKETIINLVKNKNCLLLPIVNQDLGKEEKSLSNQFTKDWNAIFEQNNPWRLTPEFSVSYRKATPNYPTSEIGNKRYSRFQMIGHFLCDYIPKSNDYISNREQIENFKVDEKQIEAVKAFHKKLKGGTVEDAKNEEMNALLAKFDSPNKKQKAEITKKSDEKFYVFGIDRGQKELATLCVIDQDKKIISDFEIYTRSFNTVLKQWEHKLLEKRHILDLSNLRVETTIVIDEKPTKKKVLVDISEVKVKDKNGNFTKPNKMQIKMQQLAYIRKLQFQLQTNPDGVLEWYNKNNTSDAILNNLVDKENGEKGLISFYGAAVEELKDTLPIAKIEEIFKKFKELKEKEKSGETVKMELDQLLQLEPVDNLKAGVVANMVGVIAYLLEKFDYQVYISLEDLSKSFSSRIVGGIGGVPINADRNEGRRIDVEKYAGLGLYNFFEMQLLKKLFRIQQNNNNILHLVPSFRAMKDYDHIAAGKGKVKNRFGNVFFVDAEGTSICCPKCGAYNKSDFKLDMLKYPNAQKGTKSADANKKVWVDRNKSDGKDIIKCFVCGFDTTKEYTENPLKFIKSGDDNAAFLISVEGIKAYQLATTLIN